MKFQPTKTHQPCPKCGHKDCYTEFNTGWGYCHSTCNGWVPPENAENYDDSELTFDYLPYRSLREDTVRKLGILSGIDRDGRPVSRVYPYPHRPKLRILPKDFSQNIGFSNDFLIGMDKFNAGSSKFITITEGEDDWAAVYQMLNNGSPVVGLPSASSVKGVMKNEECKKYLDSFGSIIIATDSDQAGDQAAKLLDLMFPNKCYRVLMTKYKDPMEYLENGANKEFLYSWINRQKFVKEFDTNTPDQFKHLVHNSVDSIYLPTGIEGYDEVGMGLFQGEFTVFTAPEGVGKTEFMRYLEYNLIANHPGLPFAYCHLEETPQRSVLGLASYHLNKNVTRKNLISDMLEVDQAIEEMMGGENVHQFSLATDEDPDVLIERLRYYANFCDCKYAFFEPIQDVAHQRKDGKSTVEFLDSLSVNISRLCSETGLGVVAVAHMNDDGQVRDSRQIAKQASVRVDLNRDMFSDHEDERMITRLNIKKNRPGSYVGPAGQLRFNPDTFTLKEDTYI